MDEKSWVALSFIIFIAAIFKPVSKFLATSLDGRAAQIKRDLQEAKELKAQAQSLLESFQKKQIHAQQEINELIANAQRQSQIMLDEAQKKLDLALKNRGEQLLKKIANAESAAIKELSQKTIDNVIGTATSTIIANLNDDLNQHLIDDSIAQIKQHFS